ncbi:hypothetical protein [uncultured Microscilla sp.]|uniref:hypothetical protein n=1 Tax=uncultured Microscilla sp. TaxID=432653 RepID=UPI0026383F2C|nr:hypothetical protein [uncultured Microscilla sp.]
MTNNKDIKKKLTWKSVVYPFLLLCVFIVCLLLFKYFELRSNGKYTIAKIVRIEQDLMNYHTVTYTFRLNNKDYQGSTEYFGDVDCQIVIGDKFYAISSSWLPSFNSLLVCEKPVKPGEVIKGLDTMKIDKKYIIWHRFP